jgi:hypothetical protein
MTSAYLHHHDVDHSNDTHIKVEGGVAMPLTDVLGQILADAADFDRTMRSRTW